MHRGCAVIITALLLWAPLASAQEAKSPDLVKQLTQLLDQKKLDSIAAPDAQNAGIFAAALYFPGSQLLVVSAKYAAPVLLNDKIAKKDYRDVYIDLSSASVAGTKMFIIDANADGLTPKPGEDQAGDSYENGKTQVAFDGAKKAKMSDAEYAKVFSDADTAYCRVLQLLINQLKSGT
jgi:hypothetical protein